MSIPRELAERLVASYALLEGRHQQLSSLFYKQLFAAAPQVRELFAADMETQKKMLVTMLELVVKHARDIELIRPKLMELGERHHAYGVSNEHYPIVIASLTSAMRTVSSDKWTERDTEDWVYGLTIIAEIMLMGSENAKCESQDGP